jgi:uncharacterized protein (UPF0332 family)
MEIGMTSLPEIKLYMDRARAALQQSSDNLGLGHYDVATSRAYYAMFYAATALLLSQGISRSKHSGVHSAFGQYFVKPGLIEPQYSQMLVNAFRLRLDSDYEVSPSLNKVLAEDNLRDAEQFVERAETYLQQEGYL